MTAKDKTSKDGYRVLARKYRPQTFSALIGQDAMVQTLKNAIDTGRLAHAFILTGVRGVGKTTTARLIARALNCVGRDGQGGPTVDPCGECEFCVSIAASSHPDVIEMDAASHTGVDDIRTIIDNAPYAAASARFKVYIIDEVHMLSKSAFNALLKTLEEPPAHVKFIFATTEIRKVPVTVLSRCQRFDLRRVDAALLAEHFSNILKEENCDADEEALAMIAKAAEGSVRDGLSLLDQAIAHGGGKVETTQVRTMLGLADRNQVIDLFEALMEGDVPKALDQLSTQYEAGADPIVVLEDLLSFTHWVTRLKLAEKSALSSLVSEAEKTRGKALAEKLGVAHLTRTWQILLKGLDEVRRAPNTLSAAEMVLIRLMHASNLPNPADLVKKLKSAPTQGAAPQKAPTGAPSGPSAEIVQHPRSQQRMSEKLNIQSFEQMVSLFEKRKEGIIWHALNDHCHLVSFEPKKVELRLSDKAPRDLASRMMTCLEAWTGERWMVVLSAEKGQDTLQKK
ncbi:MAG: DNA polymerase III subunit gamma/tau, partial [Sphingomonadales bacterium]